MGRIATPQIRTACGMGKCPRKFAGVAAAMRHVKSHPPIANAPTGKEPPIWRTSWKKRRDGYWEIRNVVAGPLPNLPIRARQNAQDGQGAALTAKATG